MLICRFDTIKMNFSVIYRPPDAQCAGFQTWMNLISDYIDGNDTTFEELKCHQKPRFWKFCFIKISFDIDSSKFYQFLSLNARETHDLKKSYLTLEHKNQLFSKTLPSKEHIPKLMPFQCTLSITSPMTHSHNHNWYNIFTKWHRYLWNKESKLS